MSANRVQADSEALAELRQEFDYFYADQRAAMERAIWLGDKALDDLEHAAYKWQARADHCETELRHCLEEARHAAAFGGYVDCSSWERALADCHHNLDVVQHWRMRVEAAVEDYKAAAASLRHWFDFELPRVKRFLDDRIKALKAFLAANVRSD